MWLHRDIEICVLFDVNFLRKKRPQHLAKLRRVGQVDDSELDTYQKMLLVFPKKK